MSEPAAKKRKTGVEKGPTITDPRFANIQSDPRYRLPGKKHRVKADKRFARALQDDDFSRKSKVDRYGRPINADAEKQRLKRKYDFGDDLEDQSDEPDDDDDVQKELQRVDESRDLLREGKDVSSSDEDSLSDDDNDVEEDVAESAGLDIQEDNVMLGDVTSRLAVVNLDWDNIRAEDLMAVFTSFLPPAGKLLKVAVYPSSFGKERMEREELEGPPKEIFSNAKEASGETSESEEDEDDIKADMMKPDDGADFDSTALRQYQLDRLRYYYALLTFSSSGTARAVYDSVDGTEYLSTANFFDLRFVPDETDFSSDKPRDECTNTSSSYKPNDFVTDALQHSKVKLTWDADDGSRKEAQARAFRGSRQDIDENDLKAYLASDTESGQSEAEHDQVADTDQPRLSKKESERQRMRALLGLGAEPVKKSKKEKDGPVGNIQITFSSGLGGLANEHDSEDAADGEVQKRKSKRSVFENSPEPQETTVEKYVRKEKERKQRRKDKTKSNKPGDEGEAPAAINEDQGDDDLGFDDPFFAEPLHDKKSANKIRKEERLKKKQERAAEEAATAKQRAELELLMADDDVTSGSKGRAVQHFDMDEIAKAEKAAAKKGKKGKKSKSQDNEKTLVSDDFKINTADPRFSSLYENHEFAIDPSDPRFTNAKGMKALVEEGRRRKNRVLDEHDNDKKGNQDKSTKDKHANQDNVSSLVAKIKKRSQAA